MSSQKKIKMNKMDIVKVDELVEKIIEINYYMLEAIKADNKKEALKNKIELDSLLKLYLKDQF